MPIPIAYLLTWTCYGTWLHGDERGSADVNHNRYQTPYLPPNHRFEALRVSQRKHPVFLMSNEHREVVEATIIAHVQIRQWRLHALNVHTNHIHVVVSAPVDPERVMIQFKAWCTRKLRAAKLLDQDHPGWTEHGSTRYLWDDDSLAGAIRYVRDGQ